MDASSSSLPSFAEFPDPANQVIKVIIADDHTFFRDGVVSLLDATPGIRVIGTASDGEACVKLARERKPDVILMDIEMPRLGGLAATRQILERDPQIHIIIFSMSENADTVGEAIKCDALGYLLKDAEREQLIAAIRTVNNGSMYLGKEIRKRVKTIIGRENTDLQEAFKQLSNRELDLLLLLASDKTNKEIASQLHPSPSAHCDSFAHAIRGHRRADFLQIC